MSETTPFERRVGNVRPSHLMFTSGVGSLVDLPELLGPLRGLDDWNYQESPRLGPIAEPRLLAAVQAVVGRNVVET